MRRTHPPRTLAACAAALALALGATACDSDSPPTTATTASSSAAPTVPSSTSTTSSSPTTSTSSYVPVKPKFPAAAKSQSAKGAEAFVRYYLEVVNYAWTKPDPKALEGLADESCKSCIFFADTAKEMASKGERYATPVTKTRSTSFVLESGDEVRYLVKVDQLASNRVDAADKIVVSDPPQSLDRIVVVQWDGGWRVFALGEP